MAPMAPSTRNEEPVSVSVSVHEAGKVWVVTIDRVERKNAVDRRTARLLSDAFQSFERDEKSCVAILHGAGQTFCAGADLKALASTACDPSVAINDLQPPYDDTRYAPMGPSRLELSKPVIAAIEGHAVAGGLELACWCDLRVCSPAAVFGVYCRSKGVPLIDGGTIRLPRLLGLSRALDLILTGRPVSAQEALAIGLVNRIANDPLAEALRIARDIAAMPQLCMRRDRQNAIQLAFHLPEHEALVREITASAPIVHSEGIHGALQFTQRSKL
eukprot:ANDGO_04397.mRNA.1 Carnitinyl-CoA dehydratase